MFDTKNEGQVPVKFKAILTDQFLLWSIQNVQSVYQQGRQVAQAQFQETLHAFSSERALLLQKIEESEAKRKEMQAQGESSTGGIRFMQYEYDR